MNTCELTERAGWIFPKNSEVICLGRPLARRQQKLIVSAGRRVCGRPQTRVGCGRDAARTRLRAPADAGGTHVGRVSDAVFGKLFLGGTVFIVIKIGIGSASNPEVTVLYGEAISS